MKALTLHRPWGYAIAHLGKDIENRSWPCYLTPGTTFAIHNGQKWDKSAADFMRTMGLEPPTETQDKPGQIIAAVRFEGNDNSPKSKWHIPGQIGWKLSKPTILKPIPIKGAQGLWTIPGPELVQFIRQLQAKGWP